MVQNWDINSAANLHFGLQIVLHPALQGGVLQRVLARWVNARGRLHKVQAQRAQQQPGGALLAGRGLGTGGARKDGSDARQQQRKKQGSQHLEPNAMRRLATLDNRRSKRHEVSA